MLHTSIKFTLIVSLILLFCSQNPSGVSECNYDWTYSTPYAEGIDTCKFNAAMGFIGDTIKGVRSVIIVRNGKLVFERYYHFYNVDTTYLMNSTTKSIINVLTGIAIKDNLIEGGLKAKVLSFFPEFQFENLSDDKKMITIENILTMRTGLQWNDSIDDFYDNPDPIKFILDKPMDTTPGIEWNYNSGTPHILSAIIGKVSGKSTLQFAKEKLFDPLGIRVYNWQVDSKGIPFGGYGLYLTPKDLAKIGLLFLNKGMWNGTELLSEEWVKSSTDSITSTYWPENGSYGYLWWINYFGGYSSRGAHGQNMYVFPDKNLIIVFTSDMAKNYADGALNFIVRERILPSIN